MFSYSCIADNKISGYHVDERRWRTNAGDSWSCQ